MVNVRHCLHILGFDATIAAIPTWPSLRRAYLRRVRLTHPDRCTCKCDEFIRVRDAYRHLCDGYTPGATIECDSDDDEVDQAGTGHVQTVRLPLKQKTAQFAGLRFLMTGTFRINGDASECGTRGQSLVRKLVEINGGLVLKTLNHRISCVLSGHGAHEPTLRAAQKRGIPVIGARLLVTAVKVGFQQALEFETFDVGL